MRSHHRLSILSAALGLGFLLAPKWGATFQPNDADLPPPDFSTETRGPVHEAFAQPNEGKPDLSLPVDKEPPPLLPERPPEQRPDNPNVEWIPGYWAWDADRNDFVWVTGTFRNPPPGRRWVPGHWADSPDGWRWAPGFWASENQPDLRYTPEPPAPLENGPTLPPPNDNSTYIPGYWVYNGAEQRFAWRPGYWAPFRNDRVWTNPQYSWTPRGYAYTDGYWDYPLDNRGMLFAPAYFPTPLWNNPGWYYQPRYVVSLGAFYNSGFYRPGFNHFYFGNYYGNNYASLGYRPWWGAAHNPAFNYYAWQHRANAQFVAQQQLLYNNRMAGRAPLPPSNFAQQQALLKANGAHAQTIVAPIARFAPTTGKMVPNHFAAAQNLQIRHVQDLSQLRSAAEKSPAKAIAPAGKGMAAALPALKLPPAPSRARPDGVPGATSFAKNVGGTTNTGNGFTKGLPANPHLVPGPSQLGGPGPRPIVANPGLSLHAGPKGVDAALPNGPRQLQPGGPGGPAPRPGIGNPGLSLHAGPNGVNAAPPNGSRPLQPGGPGGPAPRPTITNHGPTNSAPPAVNHQPRPGSISTAPPGPRIAPAPPALRSLPGPSRSFSAPAMSRPSASMGGGARFGGGGARGGGGGKR